MKLILLEAFSGSIPAKVTRLRSPCQIPMGFREILPGLPTLIPDWTHLLNQPSGPSILPATATTTIADPILPILCGPFNVPLTSHHPVISFYQTGFSTGHVVTDAGRLFMYSSLLELQTMEAGAPGGFFFDGTQLYVGRGNVVRRNTIYGTFNDIGPGGSRRVASRH
jgi:hypothetical protein